MAGFMSEFTYRLDSKGRVSVPAQFRAILAQDSCERLYCIPSPVHKAVDAGGKKLQKAIDKHFNKLTPFTEEHEHFITALYGKSDELKIDQDGRVVLSEKLKNYAEITDEVTFVGQKLKFQMWNPKNYEAYSEEASKRVREVISGSTAQLKTQEEAK